MKKNGEYIGVDEKFIPEDEKYVDESLLGDKENTRKVIKTIGIGYIIFILVILALVIGIFIFVGRFAFKVGNTISDVAEFGKDMTEQVSNFASDTQVNGQTQMSKIEIDGFNNFFEIYSGTKSKFFVIKILDEVINNNNKNSDKLITVIYNEVNTTDSNEIVKLKQSFEDGKNYEIMLGYGENGLVNKVTILDI